MGLYIWVVCGGCFLLIFFLIMRRYLLSKLQLNKLPPCPPGRWPFLGHLHLLHRPLHRSLHQLALSYGPLFFLHMGSVPTVVASSPLWTKEFLHTHDLHFSDRPHFEASKRLFYNSKTVVMMEHGPLWRELRRLYTVQLLTVRRIEMFEEAREEEMAMAMHELCKYERLCGSTREVEVRKMVFSMVGNMMTRMLFSRRLFGYGDSHASSSSGSGSRDEASCRFKEMIEEMAVLFGAPVIGDLIPWLAWLDVGGFKKRMNRLALQLDNFLDDVLTTRLREVNHVRNNVDSSCCTASNNNGGQNIEPRPNTSPQDFLGLLISIYNDPDGSGGVDGRECIKSVLLDLMSAGTETTTTTVEWAMAELLKNPSCMTKLQEELATMNQATEDMNASIEDYAESHNIHAFNLPCNKSRLIRNEDVPKLSYLQAVIKETLRLHPPLPIVVRQLSKGLANGIEVGGYKFPNKTRLLVNVWALGRDTHTWGENADHFCPDKFLAPSSLDLRGQHYELLPFGSGRRGCPGMNLGLSMVGLVLANLVNSFEWKLPYGHHNLDLSEAASRTAPMANPLIATPTRKPFPTSSL